jgi:hypothetical protein
MGAEDRLLGATADFLDKPVRIRQTGIHSVSVVIDRV